MTDLIQRGVIVVDDFTPDIETVRLSALRSGFGTWRPNKGEVGSSVYDGMNFWGNHAMMLGALMHHTGHVVVPNSMFFRVTNRDTEAAYVHSDREAGEYTCIVYLSEHSEEKSGTGFYRHRESGAVCMDSFERMADDSQKFERLKEQMVRGSEEDWELVRFVEGRYNRAVIFYAPLFHARRPRHGIGESMEDGRMVWVSHFLVKGG